VSRIRNRRRPYFKMATALSTPEDTRREIELIIVALNELGDKAGLIEEGDSVGSSGGTGTGGDTIVNQTIVQADLASYASRAETRRYAFFMGASQHG